MLKPILAMLPTILCALPCAGAAQSEARPGGAFKVGTTLRSFVPPEPYDWRGAATHALLTAIWYPADPSAQERPQLFGPPNAPLFAAGPAAPDAATAPTPAKFPLILLSHGTGGTAQSLAWLGTALAAHGYIVAGVNHPGNNALEPYTVQGFTLWWKRAQDISVVLDAMLAEPLFGAGIDRDRIAATGFSLGGYTAIELAGGITSLTRFEEFCKSGASPASCKAPPEFPDYHDKRAALAKTDAAYAAALAEGAKSYRDPRIRAAFAMAPALGFVLTPESLAAIAIPVAIAAGEGDAIVPIDASAKYLAAKIPRTELTIFPGTVGHYVFLDVCTSAGRDTLPSLCIDAPGVDRDAVHRTTADLATQFFDAHLK
jgi:predicted dienelactone hydrolase